MDKLGQAEVLVFARINALENTLDELRKVREIIKKEEEIMPKKYYLLKKGKRKKVSKKEFDKLQKKTSFFGLVHKYYTPEEVRALRKKRKK